MMTIIVMLAIIIVQQARVLAHAIVPICTSYNSSGIQERVSGKGWHICDERAHKVTEIEFHVARFRNACERVY